MTATRTVKRPSKMKIQLREEESVRTEYARRGAFTYRHPASTTELLGPIALNPGWWEGDSSAEVCWLFKNHNKYRRLANLDNGNASVYNFPSVKQDWTRFGAPPNAPLRAVLQGVRRVCNWAQSRTLRPTGTAVNESHTEAHPMSPWH